MSIQDYTLAAENEKLEVRARIFDHQSKLFLNQFIRPGQKILEIGCGMGGATRMIARLLDNTGFIDAIDMNPAYVAYVEKKLDNDGYQNFTIRQQTAESLKGKNKYDVVYGRAVLHHIPTAKNVISELLNEIKPGGIIAFEEPILNTGFALPEVKDFNKLFDWYITLGKNKGCDYLVGAKLNLYFQTLGIKILDSQILQIIVRNQPERLAILELIDTLQKQFIDAKIATQDEIDRVKRSIRNIVESDHIFYAPQFCQILGQKYE